MPAPNPAPRRLALATAAALAAVTPLAVVVPAAAGAGRDHRLPVTTTSAPGSPPTAPVPSPPVRTGAAVGSGSPAFCTAANLAAVQGDVSQGLANRVTQLSALGATVGGAGDLTAGDRSTLGSDLASELAGIQALQAKLPTDTTCASVVTDGRAMVVNFRVYVVMTPQVHLTISADTESAVAANLAGLEPTLQAAVTAGGRSGADPAAAQQALDDLETKVAAGQRASSGISAQVLGFTPASYPGSWSAFRADRATLEVGRQDLAGADADLHRLVAALG